MIRSASPTDKHALQSLCHSVDEDDYVLDHLSTWLRTEGIYVYEKEHTIVGMVRLIQLRDGKAHVGSIRVHPNFRRQGIATALTEYCISICGTDTVRLAIMDNKVSEIVAQKIGFSPVATFTFLLKSVDTPSVPVFLPHSTADKTLSLLKESPLFQQSHSLLSSSFTFYTPSAENLKDLLLFLHKDKVAILDFKIEEALKKAVQIAYCDPDQTLIDAILCTAVNINAEEIWAVIPKNEELINFLRTNGFQPIEWGETIKVFERWV